MTFLPHFKILVTFSTMHTPIGPFKTSKMTSEKPEVVITSPLITISSSFHILSTFSTMLIPIWPFMSSKMTFTKTGSSYNFDINRHVYVISNPMPFFDHVHSNRTFQDLQNNFRKTGNSYNFTSK